jgi:phosphotransferase system enzyme I (PtsI)
MHNMDTITGVSASPGISTGKAYIFEHLSLKFQSREINSVDTEIMLFERAIHQSKEELIAIKEKLSSSIGEQYGHIFRSQQTMLEDDEFLGEIMSQITEQRICAENALKTVYMQYAELFEGLGEDDYNRERVVDLTDLYQRLLRNLLGKKESSLADIPENSILVATELFPSDTAFMNKHNVCGIITEKGGVTSHVAILAKSLSIPAAVGVKQAMESIHSDDWVYVDALDIEEAIVYVNPDPDTKSLLDKKIHRNEVSRKKRKQIKDLAPVTQDGQEIQLSANVGSPEDFSAALDFGARSIGLLRTEFLFFTRGALPDEDTQYRFYKDVASRLKPEMVVIRTLDIGGDKTLPSIHIPQEENPFLGVRGIRVCLRYPDLFRVQLRAILRAAAYGNIKMMFPMITDIWEIRKIHQFIREVEDELSQEGKNFQQGIETGIMVETPAAVVMSDVLSKEVAFFSIGTNDLTQYVFAADRTNEHVREYYKLFHPGIFRMVKLVADNAHRNGKWVGICGELGGVSLAIPVLIGLGVDELSMSGQLLPQAKDVIRNITVEESKNIAEHVLNMESSSDIKEYLQHFFQ